MPHFALEDRKKENMMKIEKMKEKTARVRERAKKRERESEHKHAIRKLYSNI